MNEAKRATNLVAKATPTRTRAGQSESAPAA
jgi:hypothetical protein